MTVAIDHGVERERLRQIALDPERRELDPLHPTAVVWDLDSTVAHTLHRQHMIPRIKAGEFTWDDYSLACIKDRPFPAAVGLMSLLWRQHLQIAVSGRGAVATDLTWKWVRAHKVPLDQVALRPEGDYTPSDAFKVRELRKIQAAGITILFYVDDWPSSASAVTTELGIPSLVVNPDYPCTECGSRDRACPCGVSKMTGGGA